VGEGAVGVATVGDDLDIDRELGEPLGELVEGDGDRAATVPNGELRPAAHVQNHHHLARLGAAQEFFAADLLHALVIVGAQVLGPGDVELGEMRGGDVAQLCVEAGDVRVGRRSDDRVSGRPMIAMAGLSSGSSWALSSAVSARIRQAGIDWPIGLVFGAVRILTAFLCSRPVSQPTLLLAFAGLTRITAATLLLHARGTR